MEICRTCLLVSVDLIPLKTDKNLSEKLKALCSIDASKDSLKYPKVVCRNCKEQIESFFEFRKIILDNDKLLKLYQQKGLKPDFNSIGCIRKGPKIKNTTNKFTNIDKSTKSFGKLSNNNSKSIFEIYSNRSYNTFEENVSNRQQTKNTSGNMVKRKLKKNRRKNKTNNFNYDAKFNYVSPKDCKSAKSKSSVVKNRFKPDNSCHLCGLKFGTVGKLIKHRNCSHIEQKPFDCSFCMKKFTSKYSLQTHWRQHAGNMPFICEICGVEFASKTSLVTHMKATHKVNLLIREYRNSVEAR